MNGIREWLHRWQGGLALASLLLVFGLNISLNDSVKTAVWQQNIRSCERITKPNRATTNRKADANASGWTEAWESRRALAKITTGKERQINLRAAKKYHGIVVTLREPLLNPPCEKQWPKP